MFEEWRRHIRSLETRYILPLAPTGQSSSHVMYKCRRRGSLELKTTGVVVLDFRIR